MGSGIGLAGHAGRPRSPGKARKNTAGVVFEPFQSVLEHLERSWMPSKHYFLDPKPPGALRDTVFVDPTLSGALQNNFFDDPAPPGAHQDTIFDDSTPPRAFQSTNFVDLGSLQPLQNKTLFIHRFQHDCRRC